MVAAHDIPVRVEFDIDGLMVDLKSVVARLKIIQYMDDCMIAITDGKPIPQASLRKLPPWRAVMVARVAVKAGVMSEDECGALVDEAREVGGEGKLKEI